MRFYFTETKIKQKPQFVNRQLYRMDQHLKREKSEKFEKNYISK